MKNKEEQWYVVMLLETDDANGKFLADLLSYIRSNVDLSHVMIGDVDPAIYGLTRSYSYYTLDVLLPVFEKFFQFNWCNIFCYKSRDDIPAEDLWTLDYPSIIAKTILSVRVIDSGDTEVFTQSEQLCKSIASKYPDNKVYFGPLSEYTYPY